MDCSVNATTSYVRETMERSVLDLTMENVFVRNVNARMDGLEMHVNVRTAQVTAKIQVSKEFEVYFRIFFILKT